MKSSPSLLKHQYVISTQSVDQQYVSLVLTGNQSYTSEHGGIQQTQDVQSVFFQCWANVANGMSALN